MSTTTTNYGLIKPGTDDPILVGQLNDNMDTIDTVLKDHSNKIDAAALGIKYKGEVNYYADLPNSAEIGDAYTVKYAGSSGTTPDGTEYVWGTVSGTNQWINFSKDSYTKAEVDALLALKQNALSSTQLDAVNSGIDSEKVAQIETNKNNISFAVEKIGNNLVNVPSGSGVRWVDVTVNIPPGVYTFGFSNLSGDDIRQSQVSFYSADSSFYTYIDKGNDVYINNVTFTNTVTNIRIYASTNSTTSTNQGVNFTTLFLCKQETWNSSVGIQPYAMSNAELTAKEQANENNILTVVDWLNSLNRNLSPVYGGISEANKFIVNDTEITLPAGTYTISWISAAKTGSTVVSVFNGNSRVINQSVSNAANDSYQFTLSTACDKFNLYTSVANTISNLKIIASS